MRSRRIEGIEKKETWKGGKKEEAENIMNGAHFSGLSALKEKTWFLSKSPKLQGPYPIGFIESDKHALADMLQWFRGSAIQ
ncbi:hypothetical protein Y032_0297g1739 [Ancylostoma ceylanicum]|uniref:Uncharacterized protein n=1 Tax=Ancylostoma ceylanicum TaxID=53326 RepID=A0A016S591_9BILA|nr:hypothetical protein Y032_0297g1739 [Ancylostoma ceylanicum]